MPQASSLDGLMPASLRCPAEIFSVDAIRPVGFLSIRTKSAGFIEEWSSAIESPKSW
jgi:hypothetical protein